ncbi:MAG: hypothetical protein MJZ87_09440 [Bacteroidales bacterium]|nr:hypothetical protein [Bacteroidales bacterium]
MDFDFKKIMDGMRNDASCCDAIQEYEKISGVSLEDFKETAIYKKYISKFKVKQLRLAVPKEEGLNLDWTLLIQLVAASFATEYHFELNKNGEYELSIAASLNDITREEKISELSVLQILILFQIYIDEQIKLFKLIKESKNDKKAIESEQKMNLEHFNNIMEQIRQRESNDSKLEKLLKKSVEDIEV